MFLAAALLAFSAPAAVRADSNAAPSRLIHAITAAHLRPAPLRFTLFRGLNGKAYYGAAPDTTLAFDLSDTQQLVLDGRRFTVVTFQNGGTGRDWQMYAFFAGSLRYAGEIPVYRPDLQRLVTNGTLIIRRRELRARDALCCPTGPWKTLVRLRANERGLYHA